MRFFMDVSKKNSHVMRGFTSVKIANYKKFAASTIEFFSTKKLEKVKISL